MQVCKDQPAACLCNNDMTARTKNFCPLQLTQLERKNAVAVCNAQYQTTMFYIKYQVAMPVPIPKSLGHIPNMK